MPNTAITRQKVAGILRAKGFRAGDATPGSDRPGHITECRPGGTIEVWHWGAFITSPERKAEYARAYLAALAAAGLQAHLSVNGRTVVVPVEQGEGAEASRAHHWSTIDTKSIEERVRGSAAKVFGRGKARPVFEHGHWWVVVENAEGDAVTYDVVDAPAQDAGAHFDFEEVG